jgi:octaprenyl-diphosphate synthase
MKAVSAATNETQLATETMSRLLALAPEQRSLTPHMAALLDAQNNARREVEGAVATWVAGFPESAAAAASHLLAAGGKRVRPVLTLLSAAASGGKLDGARSVAVAVELLHTGTLLHDDVIDEAQTRRGRPAAHVVFGNSLAVLAGDFCYFAALDALIAHGDLKLLERAMDIARKLATGELLQLERRGSGRVVDEAQYLEVIERKTSALFSFATWGGARAAGAPEAECQALDRYGSLLGTAFQVVDDVLDFTGDEAVVGKSLGHDLAEGIVTLPLTYAIEQHPALAHKVEAAAVAVRQGDANKAAQLAQEVGEAVRKSQAVPRCVALVRALTEAALAELRPLPPSQALSALVAIAEALRTRAA